MGHHLTIPEVLEEGIYSNMHTFIHRPTLSDYTWHFIPWGLLLFWNAFALWSNRKWKMVLFSNSEDSSSKFCCQPNIFFNSSISTHISSEVSKDRQVFLSASCLDSSWASSLELVRYISCFPHRGLQTIVLLNVLLLCNKSFIFFAFRKHSPYFSGALIVQLRGLPGLHSFGLHLLPGPEVSTVCLEFTLLLLLYFIIIIIILLQFWYQSIFQLSVLLKR